MNPKFKAAVQESFLSCDQTMMAEIFNIYASDYDNLDQLRKEELYVFNILDNKQAARAVAKFGLEAVANAAKEDWIVYAEKEKGKDWTFSSKSPESAVTDYLESIIYDIISRPKDYPSWVIERVAPYVCHLAEGILYN